MKNPLNNIHTETKSIRRVFRNLCAARVSHYLKYAWPR